MFGRWGFLPIAVPGAVFVAQRLGALAFPKGRSSDRAVAAGLLGPAFGICALRLLGLFHRVTGPWILGSLLLTAVALAAVPTSDGPALPRRQLLTRSTVPMLVCACIALAVAILAAYWLPVWQWDALGYHLPYVNFVLLGRGFDGVPDDVPYVSTYPHNVETLIVALRAMLPDDHLVDLAQIPFGVIGAVATAAIARRFGAPRPAALVAGLAWIVIPAVFLQLPTDYIDVASTAFLLSALYFVFSVAATPHSDEPMARRYLLAGGIALGLFLGAKPSAPFPTVVVSVLLLWGARRAGQVPVAVAALALVIAFGGGGYIENTALYHNPVWPVQVKIGPILLRGVTPMQHLLDSGAAAPRLHGSLPSRVIRSWTALRSPPVFDMRIGGLGPIVLLAAPFAFATVLMRSDVITWGALCATVISPDPAVARYVLGLPALVLALASPRVAALPSRVLPWLGAIAGILGIVQIGYAWPGLSGEGPPLEAYARMTDAQRDLAVGANGPPTPFLWARRRIGPDETFAFDQSLDLPYLAWDSDLRYRAVFIPDTLPSNEVEDFLKKENVRVVAVADDSPTGRWLAQKSERFLKLFPCKSAPCTVFARR